MIKAINDSRMQKSYEFQGKSFVPMTSIQGREMVNPNDDSAGKWVALIVVFVIIGYYVFITIF